jgi:hypothetical protein
MNPAHYFFLPPHSSGQDAQADIAVPKNPAGLTGYRPGPGAVPGAVKQLRAQPEPGRPPNAESPAAGPTTAQAGADLLPLPIAQLTAMMENAKPVDPGAEAPALNSSRCPNRTTPPGVPRIWRHKD